MTYIATEGNVLADAVLRQTHAGTPVANAVIRVDFPVRSDDGSYREGASTDYEVTVFGKPAEHFVVTAARGARIFAAGELTVESYTDGNGATRIRQRITAEHYGVSTRYAPAASRRRNGGQ